MKILDVVILFVVSKQFKAILFYTMMYTMYGHINDHVFTICFRVLFFNIYSQNTTTCANRFSFDDP